MVKRAQPQKSAQELKDFLDDNIFSVIEISDVYSTNIEMQRIIKSSKKTLNSLSTAIEVVDFFWNAIIEKSHSYDVVIEHGLPTFEDIRYRFDLECYGFR